MVNDSETSESDYRRRESDDIDDEDEELKDNTPAMTSRSAAAEAMTRWHPPSEMSDDSVGGRRQESRESRHKRSCRLGTSKKATSRHGTAAHTKSPQSGPKS